VSTASAPLCHRYSIADPSRPVSSSPREDGFGFGFDFLPPGGERRLGFVGILPASIERSGLLPLFLDFLLRCGACNKTVFFGVFPMFVPSLSWQNDNFYIYMAQKDRFLTSPPSCSFVPLPKLVLLALLPGASAAAAAAGDKVGRPESSALPRPRIALVYVTPSETRSGTSHCGYATCVYSQVSRHAGGQKTHRAAAIVNSSGSGSGREGGREGG